MMIKINDSVRLVADVLGSDLKKGQVGVVVVEFSSPEHAYEVEFSDENGRTISQVALLPTQIELVVR